MPVIRRRGSCLYEQTIGRASRASPVSFTEFSPIPNLRKQIKHEFITFPFAPLGDVRERIWLQRILNQPFAPGIEQSIRNHPPICAIVTGDNIPGFPLPYFGLACIAKLLVDQSSCIRMNRMENLGNRFLSLCCNNSMIVVRHNGIGRQVKLIYAFIVLQLVNNNLGKSGVGKPALPFMSNTGYEVSSTGNDGTKTVACHFLRRHGSRHCKNCGMGSHARLNAIRFSSPPCKTASRAPRPSRTSCAAGRHPG